MVLAGIPVLCKGAGRIRGERDWALTEKAPAISPAPPQTVQGCGSPVVKVSNHGRHVMSSIPVPLKTPPCRAAMHVKSVES
ncbi:hypothetical protein TNCV_1373151 [Trichonephila clavipes]|uniref:Uncharacterized protein n=1 Tax=Trichonephila clavipes TaxID=2585209 RepID=A0A8X7BLH0_TRICX|nr:hypothetical protein TNCV_1373151 [Trichonephila clavipes]